MKKMKMSPIMTVKELREYIDSKPDINEATEYLNDLKFWFFDQLIYLTLGEETAYKTYLNRLYRYIEEGKGK